MSWKLFFLTYGLLFLAELGDKTQLAVLTLTAQYKSPLPIFLGASLAMATVTLIGALVGETAARYIPANYVHLGAAVLFIGIGFLLLWQSITRL